MWFLLMKVSVCNNIHSLFLLVLVKKLFFFFKRERMFFPVAILSLWSYVMILMFLKKRDTKVPQMLYMSFTKLKANKRRGKIKWEKKRNEGERRIAICHNIANGYLLQNNGGWSSMAGDRWSSLLQSMVVHL